MNKRSTGTLVVVALLLVVGVVVIDTMSDGRRPADDGLLLPALGDRINDVQQVVARYAGESATLVQNEGRWVVQEKDGYPADTGTLRQVLTALGDAGKLERKTANPAMHGRLGLAQPGDGDSVGLTVAGDGFEHTLVIGNVAQQRYRYVRFADEDQGWLIDRNPEIPDVPAGWLLPQVMDIAAASVQSVAIEHADGERIRFAKSSPDDPNFAVRDLPEGRELSYPGVVGGIAGALQNLELDDVRRAPANLPDAAVTTRFVTFDGLALAVRQYRLDDTAWMTFDAEAGPQDAAAAADNGTPAAAASGDAAAEDTPAAAENPDALPADDAGDAAPAAPDPAAVARELNARVAGWFYRLPAHKSGLLARRWDELLKAPADDAN